jgi:hypothetical protein
MMINENKANLVQNKMEKAYEHQNEFTNMTINIHQNDIGKTRVSKWAKYLDDNEDY